MTSGINWDDIPEEKNETKSGINWDDVPEEQEKKQPDSFFKRALTGLVDPFVGGAQLIANAHMGKYSPFMVAPNTIAKLATGDEYGETFNPAKEMNKMVKEREANYNAPEGFDAARLTGNAINPITWVGPGKAKVGAKLTQQVAKHAGANAGLAAFAPTTGDDFFQSKRNDALIGASLGGAMTGVGKFGGAGYDWSKRNFSSYPEQATIYLRSLFDEDKIPEVVSALRRTKAKVPGQTPTVSWVADRFPQMGGLEKQARTTPNLSDRFAKIDAYDTAAMLRYMDEMIGEGADVFDPVTGKRAKTPIQVDAIQRTGPMYNKAAGEVVHFPKTKMDAVKEITSDTLIPKEKNIIAGWDQAASVVRGSQGGPIMEPSGSNIPGIRSQKNDQIGSGLPTNSIGELQNLRQGVDKIISSGRNATDVRDVQRVSDAIKTRAGLTDWMKGVSPSFKEAEDAFIESITPQNRADFMKVLRGNYANAGGTSVNPGALIKGIDDATTTARQAGIRLRVDSLPHAMNPQVKGGQEAINKVTMLRNVAEDEIKRKTAAGVKLPQVKGISDKIEEATPPLIDPKITITKRILKTIGIGQTEKMNDLINQAVLNPSKMADLVEAIPPEKRNTFINQMRGFIKSPVGRSASGAVKLQTMREEG